MKAADVDLAKLAHARGWISEDRLTKSLAEADRYQALGLDKPVDEILVEQGSLTSEQVRSLRDALGLTLRYPKIGDYEILRRVGIGGMGTVFEACHIRLKQRIALKILRPKLSKDPLATGRFLREARTLARLNHPHLVHAVDAGQDGEHYYLAMEYIEGENLLQVILREGPLPPERTCEIARDVCEALGALEAKGLVHRDVKPANILIGLDGVVKLADFGLLAPVEETGGPVNGPVCGTPHYISPEQASRKADVDIRSDFYSLGASWYHILTGQPPFTGKSTKEIVQGHLYRPPVPPSRVRAAVPAALDQLLLRWLSKEKSARPSSAREALAEIDRALEAMQPAPRWKTWLRPRWIACGVAAILSIALALFLATRRPDGDDLVARTSTKVPGIDAAAPRPAASRPTRIESGAGDPARTSAAPAPDVSAPPAGSNVPPAVAPAQPQAVGAEHQARPLAGPDAPPQRILGPLITRSRNALEELSARAAARWTGLAGRAADSRGRFEPARRLASTFHAGFVAIEPNRDPPSAIFLRYDFARASEIEDFRSRPGMWSAQDRALVATPDSRGEPLESLAWLVKPVRVSGRLLAPGCLIVGLGDLRVAPGRGEDSRIWREKDEAASVAVLAAPPAAAGEWTITFREGTVEIIVGGKTFSAPDAPSAGADPMGAGARFILKLAAGLAITRLEIEGSLEPTWSRERLRLAREIR